MQSPSQTTEVELDPDWRPWPEPCLHCWVALPLLGHTCFSKVPDFIKGSWGPLDPPGKASKKRGDTEKRPKEED